MLWGDGRRKSGRLSLKYWRSRRWAIGGPQMELSIGGRSDHADRLMGSVSRGVRLVLPFKSPDFFPRLQCSPDTINQWRFPSPPVDDRRFRSAVHNPPHWLKTLSCPSETALRRRCIISRPSLRGGAPAVTRQQHLRSVHANI